MSSASTISIASASAISSASTISISILNFMH